MVPKIFANRNFSNSGCSFVLTPSYNCLGKAFPPSVSDLRPCHSGQEKKGGSSHLFGPFFVLMRHFGMFDFQTFGM